MAAPHTPSADLTRHQLDELDALLQRMLNLPLAAPPAAAGPVPAPAPVLVPLPADWRADPGPVAARAPHVAAALPAWAAPVVVAEPADADEPAALPFPVPEPRTLRGVDAPATPVGFAPVPLDSASDEPVPLAQSGVVAAEPPPFAAPAGTVPLIAWPAVALNAVIEAGLGCLGPLGRGLMAPGVKHLFGAAGVVMLAGAAGWAARGAGLIR